MDSEYENAEQKIDNALLWKLRLPKKCSKYLPEEVRAKHKVGCRNDLESFDENMLSIEPCFCRGGNERSSGTKYIK